MVISERFERSTHSLEGCCSIQLSYETVALIFKPNVSVYQVFFNPAIILMFPFMQNYRHPSLKVFVVSYFYAIDIIKRILTNQNAGVVKLADTPDLGSGGFGRGGSSPFARTMF